MQDWCPDAVYTWWEVDDCPFRRCRVAILTTTVSFHDRTPETKRHTPYSQLNSATVYTPDTPKIPITQYLDAPPKSAPVNTMGVNLVATTYLLLLAAALQVVAQRSDIPPFPADMPQCGRTCIQNVIADPSNFAINCPKATPACLCQSPAFGTASVIVAMTVARKTCIRMWPSGRIMICVGKHLLCPHHRAHQHQRRQRRRRGNGMLCQQRHKLW